MLSWEAAQAKHVRAIGGNMRERIWNAEYEGHKIRVISKNSYFPPRTTDILEIDDQVIQKSKISIFDFFSTLYTRYSFDGSEKIVEARLAQKSDALKSGCQIFIDGTQIGGDYQIKYPDPAKVDGYLKGGYIKFVLRVGILRMGIPFAIMFAFYFRTDPIRELIIKVIVAAFVFGLTMSSMSWNGLKARTKALTPFKR